MNKSLALLVTTLAMSSMASVNAASYSSADMKARQQLAQSITQAAVDTSGARATAAQDTQNILVSRQFTEPTLSERHADVIASAVYPQAGPATASLAANNAALSNQMSRQTMKFGTPAAERRMDKAATP